MINREKLAAAYLDYLNNYLSVARWAEDRGLTYAEGMQMWHLCRSAYFNEHPDR